MSNFTAGDVSGLQQLTESDHLYETHINELRQSLAASAAVGRTTDAEYYCDGTADEVEIQAAIDAVSAAGGGIVHLKAGQYQLADHLIMKEKVILEGEGDGTVVSIPTGKRISNRISATNTNYPCDNIKIRDFLIDCTGQGLAGTEEQAISLYNVQNVEISGMHIEAWGFGIFIGATNTTFDGEQDSAYVRLHHNYIHGRCLNDLIGGGMNNDEPNYIVRDMVVDHNHLVHDHGLAEGDYFNAIDVVGVKRITFDSNTTEGNMLFGNERDPHAYSTITNNIVKPPLGSTDIRAALIVQDELNAGDTSGKMVVSGNIVYGGHIRISGSSAQHIQNLVVANNFISQNTALTDIGHLFISANGVYIRYCDGAVVQGNWCEGNGTASTGISIEDSLNAQVQGNRIDNHDTGLKELNTVSGSVFSENYITNCATPITLVASSDAVVFNNKGINPQKLYPQGNVTGATTLNRLNGRVITATLTGNITVTLTAAQRGDRLTLILTQDGTGSRTATWPSNFKKVGGTLTLSTAAAAVDTVEMEYDGTNWREVGRSLDLS